MSSRDHILQVPKFVFALRILQLVIAVVVLGLAAYVVHYYSYDGASLSIFNALAAIIIVIYNIVASLGPTALYNYWAVLGLDIFAVIFWLISFALLASETADLKILALSCDFLGDCYYTKRNLAKRDFNIHTYRNSMAAASGLGGLEFLLFIVTLVFTGIYLHRHRTAGGHCMPGASGGEAGIHHESKPTELQSQQPVYQQQPIQEQVYQQQPIYQQQPVQYSAHPDQQVNS